MPKWFTDFIAALVAVATINSLVACPYVNSAIIEPHNRLERRVEKNEDADRLWRETAMSLLNSIDKKISVLEAQQAFKDKQKD